MVTKTPKDSMTNKWCNLVGRNRKKKTKTHVGLGKRWTPWKIWPCLVSMFWFLGCKYVYVEQLNWFMVTSGTTMGKTKRTQQKILGAGLCRIQNYLYNICPIHYGYIASLLGDVFFFSANDIQGRAKKDIRVFVDFSPTINFEDPELIILFCLAPCHW